MSNIGDLHLLEMVFDLCKKEIIVNNNGNAFYDTEGFIGLEESMRMYLLQVGQQLQEPKVQASQPVTHGMCFSCSCLWNLLYSFSHSILNNGANKKGKVCVNMFACDMY